MPKVDARAVFAARLKAARQAAGLTQEALGIRAGIPADVARTRVNRYERGVHDSDSATAQNLADCLGVPLASLYADDEVMAEAIRAFASLPPAEQRAAVEDLRARAANFSERPRT
ncbi:helix-turn-helix domain-containing protein [Cognatilysobacter terrigena]|uniref:helix-turn-helix domain-containing protein n=1 Tax=Cognatilysobacter terrigena TaxID=2488749 RepID=UPI00105E5955|nr:helix-turn-helix transcriptional regulator [Lysobacter terrigena]